MRRILAALALTSLTGGCAPLFNELLLDSRPLMRIHVPPIVQVGQTFPVVVDVDFGCTEFRQVAANEDAPAKVIHVDVMVKRQDPGMMCPGGIVVKRHETTARASAAGTYQVSFKGYNGRWTKAVEVTEAPAPAWTPPPFEPSATTNY